jgi:carbamate kinase
MELAAPVLAQVVGRGHELILTHGNGPQVGRLLRQDELAEGEVPYLPIHVLVAESAGQIGYLIQEALAPAFRRVGARRTVVPFVCRMEVATTDPAFRRPTKPVGRYYSDSEARRLRRDARWTMANDRSRGGWRRLLPSPRPRRWLEGRTVRDWLERGFGQTCVPVVTGGGGVPVVARGRGRHDGVEAVIDKDLAAALVARQLNADVLVIATDVPGIALGFRSASPVWLRKASLRQLGAAAARGEFDPGSMGPKVEAVTEFVRRTGRVAIVTEVSSLVRALDGGAGTTVSRL